MFRQTSFYRLLLLAVPIGLIVGLAVIVYFALIHLGTAGIWETLPSLIGINHARENPLYILVMTTIGGLLVGLCAHFLKSDEEVDILKEMKEEGRVDIQKVPGTLVVAFVSLVMAGSVGPEASLMDMGAGLGAFIAKRLKHAPERARVVTFTAFSAVFGGFFYPPFGSALLALELPHVQNPSYYGLLFPAIIATVMTYGLFIVFFGSTLGGGYAFPAYPGFRFVHLIYAIPLGIIGVLAGIIFIYLFRELHYLMRPLASRPVLKGVIGGLAFGLIAMKLPLTLFSGDHELQTLLKTGLQMGPGTLLLLGLAKIVTTCVCLSTGFIGGRIFPTFFVGGAIGMAVYLLFPVMPLTVCILCVMAAMAACVLKAPISIVLLVTALIQPGLAPVMSIAVIVSFVLTADMPLMPESQAEQRSLLLSLFSRQVPSPVGSEDRQGDDE
jgi:H+/Cl- antiporter ClcA